MPNLGTPFHKAGTALSFQRVLCYPESPVNTSASDDDIVEVRAAPGLSIGVK